LNLASTVPSGWTGVLDLASLSVGPGGSASTTLRELQARIAPVRRRTPSSRRRRTASMPTCISHIAKDIHTRSALAPDEIGASDQMRHANNHTHSPVFPT
jgi:hypothetical protein